MGGPGIPRPECTQTAQTPGLGARGLQRPRASGPACGTSCSQQRPSGDNPVSVEDGGYTPRGHPHMGRDMAPEETQPHLRTATHQVPQATERDPAHLRVGQADPQRPVQKGGRHGLGGDGERALSRQASVGPENLLKTADAHTLYLGECHGVGISPK